MDYDWKMDSLLPPDALAEKYSAQGEHPHHTREKWCDAVALQDTLRGYWDWVEACIEQDVDKRIAEPERVTLRLTLDVTYLLNRTTPRDLKDNLRDVASHLVDTCFLVEGTDAQVVLAQPSVEVLP